jgi:hypothetical protein
MKLTRPGALISEALEVTKRRLSPLPRNGLSTYSLGENYLIIIQIIESRLSNLYGRPGVVVAPPFPGCGILMNCEGDIILDDSLIEIKAGDRPFLSSDLKQLIIYAALRWLANGPSLRKFELHNPRLGKRWVSDIDDVMKVIGNNSKEEVYEEISRYLIDQAVMPN